MIHLIHYFANLFYNKIPSSICIPIPFSIKHTAIPLILPWDVIISCLHHSVLLETMSDRNSGFSFFFFFILNKCSSRMLLLHVRFTHPCRLQNACLYVLHEWKRHVCLTVLASDSLQKKNSLDQHRFCEFIWVKLIRGNIFVSARTCHFKAKQFFAICWYGGTLQCDTFFLKVNSPWLEAPQLSIGHVCWQRGWSSFRIVVSFLRKKKKWPHKG